METTITPEPTQPNAVGALYKAYQEVLKDSFDEQFHALARSRSWYDEGLPGDEVFRLWVCDHIDAASDGLWVFEPIRATERPLLCDALGISRTDIRGTSPTSLAATVLSHCGLSLYYGRTAEGELGRWREYVQLIENGDDERTATLLRSAAERLLKRILHFHAATSVGPALLQVLRNPGTLRVPRCLEKAAADADDERGIAEILVALPKDVGADLGFLIICLRRVESSLASSASFSFGSMPSLLLTSEQAAFESLARALQPYMHDKMISAEERRLQLLQATAAVSSHVGGMVDRGTIPHEGVVVEIGRSLFGSYFRAKNGGRSQIVMTHVLPALGERVLYKTLTTREFSSGRWVVSPWEER